MAVEHGSFSKAAKLMFVSSQAVANAISAMEKDLQLSLFDRSAHGTKPTDYAMLLVPKAKEALQAYKALRSCADLLAEDNTDDTDIAGALSVAVTSSPYEGGVIPKRLFDKFSGRYPMVDLTGSHNLSGVCISALLDGMVDAAIILGRLDRRSSDGIACEKLFDAYLRVVVSRKHPLSGKGTVSLRELSEHPMAKPSDLRFCHPILSRQFANMGIRPEFIDLDPTLDDYHALIHDECGVVFVTYDPHLEKLYTDVTFLSLSIEKSIKIPVCLVFKQGDKARIISALQRFLIKNIKTA
jgi:DNA-binding transcriptional LysR family regulator